MCPIDFGPVGRAPTADKIDVAIEVLANRMEACRCWVDPDVVSFSFQEAWAPHVFLNLIPLERVQDALATAAAAAAWQAFLAEALQAGHAPQPALPSNP